MKIVKIISILLLTIFIGQNLYAGNPHSPIGGPLIRIYGHAIIVVTGPGHASTMVRCITRPTETCLFRKLSIEANEQNEMCFPSTEIPDYNNIFDPQKSYIGLYDTDGNLNYTEVQKSTVVSCNDDELVIEIIY